MKFETGVKPHLSLSQILQMNLGFLGLQFSFGLQQANMTPIYSFLGAEPEKIPLLSLAGPLSGLIVQPIIGAMSDKTGGKWGRRTPYFVAGAIMCTIGLFFMPLSSSILMAVCMLWIMDIGNNTTMEPYRAYVADRLNPDQHQVGFLSQSAFTCLAQCLAFIMPTALVLMGMNKDWVDENNIPYTARFAFWAGAALSLATVLYSIWRVPELPLTQEQRDWIKAQPKGIVHVFTDVVKAIVEMPTAMRKLAIMSLFQWYGMSIYWAYAMLSIARSVYNTSDAQSPEFRSAALTNGEVAAFYNVIGFVAAFAMVPLARRFGAGIIHSVCLVLGGIAMLLIPQMNDKAALFLPAIGMGLCWGSIMGNPYIILANSIPPERTGVYMGVFNMMIVIPMLINAATLPFLYKGALGNDPRNVMMFGGVLLIFAAISVLWVKEGWRKTADAVPVGAPH
jgi:maltose/moltooligosaccharide transporter